jgi:hypothetical protein
LASYEAATPGEILEFVRRKFNFVLMKQNIDLHLGVSEFVFESALPSAQGRIPPEMQA